MRHKRLFPFFLCITLLAMGACGSKTSTLDADEALDYCARQVERALEALQPRDYTMMPRNILAGDTLEGWNCREAIPQEWCSGFWPGVLWMTYDHTGDEALRTEAERYTASLEYMASRPAYDHDLGFIIINSFLKGYELTGDAHYREVALRAADTLATLCNPTVGTMLSWPRHVGDYGGHNTIMDNMINLELLFWAAENGGGSHLRDLAVAHAATTMQHHFRPDGSCYHVAVYDTLTGDFIKGVTHQGYSDESMWSRGQAWAIYGYTMVYRFTRDERFLVHAQKVTDIYLKRLQDTCDDWVPLWDMDDPRGTAAPKDASAAAIVASALIELAGYVDGTDAQRYRTHAEQMLADLSTPYYQCGESSVAFLRHATGHHPAGSEIDASIIYADYYYIEALLRLQHAERSENPEQHYPRAILAGDYPDPTVLRDGDDFYMTHSPFVYAPGFLIWHSRDLHHWTPVTRVCPDYEGSAMAPDLIKHEGRYYIYYPTSMGEVYVIYADDIRGEWSKPVRLAIKGIDPGHVVGEDGKRYLYINDGRMVQLSDDGLRVVSEVKKVYDGWQFPEDWETEGMWLESPKLIRHNGYYYMTSAEGGTAGPATSHMCVMARSRSVHGPWEESPYNPLVHTYSADEPWWSKGHGTLVDDAQGRWWMVYHAYPNSRHTLGRYTLIEPMQVTEDGWFAPAAKKLTEQTLVEEMGNTMDDNFAGDKLGWQWTGWQENPMDKLTVANGLLTVEAKGTTPADARLLLTTTGYCNYDTQVTVNVGQGSKGGILLFYNEKAFAGVLADDRSFYLYNGNDAPAILPNTHGDTFILKIENRDDTMTLAVSTDGEQWHALGMPVDVSAMHHNNYKGFFALRVALAAVGDGKVNFSEFRYNKK